MVSAVCLSIFLWKWSYLRFSLYHCTRYLPELYPASISNYMPSKMWDEISNLFPNFTGPDIGNGYVFHSTFYYRCNYLSMLGSQSLSVKGTPGARRHIAAR